MQPLTTTSEDHKDSIEVFSTPNIRGGYLLIGD